MIQKNLQLGDLFIPDSVAMAKMLGSVTGCPSWRWGWD